MLVSLKELVITNDFVIDLSSEKDEETYIKLWYRVFGSNAIINRREVKLPHRLYHRPCGDRIGSLVSDEYRIKVQNLLEFKSMCGLRLALCAFINKERKSNE